MGLVSDFGQNPGDVMLRLANLERLMHDVLNATRLESASIGSGGIRLHGGGSVTVTDGGNVDITGGRINLRDTDGQVILFISRTTAGSGMIHTKHPDGSNSFTAGGLVDPTGQLVGTGFVQEAEGNGVNLIWGGPRRPGGPAVVQVRDPDGALVLSTSEDGLLDRPYMDVALYPIRSTGATTPWDITGITDWTTLWMGRLRYTHRGLHVQARAWAPTGTGQLRVMLGDHQIGTTATINSTTAVFVDFGADVHDLAPAGLGHYAWTNIRLEARTTTTTGRIIASPYGVTKRGL